MHADQLLPVYLGNPVCSQGIPLPRIPARWSGPTCQRSNIQTCQRSHVPTFNLQPTAIDPRKKENSKNK
jgi:hypothetical protein